MANAHMSQNHPTTGWLDRPSFPLWLGIWFGLLAGFLEASHIALLLALGELPLYGISATYPAAAPLANVVIFGGLGLLFWAMTRRDDVASQRRPVLLVFSLCFCAVVVWHVSQPWLPMHTAAQALLAIGLAVQLSRWLAARPPRLDRLVRWTYPPLLLVAAGVAVHHYQSTTATPPADVAAPADAPNVLLIVMDTVRAQSLSLYGYAKPTSPNLERLAARGVVFQRAIATAPWTLPSHASMFTGQFPQDLSTDWCAPLDDAHPTLAEELASRGYATAGMVANVYYCGRHTGLARGFQTYRCANLASLDLLRNCALGRMACLSPLTETQYGGQLQWPGRKDAGQINREFFDWLDRRPADRPYFAFLNYFDAHDPYLAGCGEEARDSCFVYSWKPDYTDRELDELRDSYERCIQELDAGVGRLIDELERRGELENTLVVITSDHGEQFGENGLVGHYNSLHLPATHVPLIVIDPRRVPAGVQVDDVVSLRDLAATVLDLTGGTRDSTIPGRSLAHYWNPASSKPKAGGPVMSHISRGIDAPDWYPNATSGLESVWSDDSYVVRRLVDGREEVFSVPYDSGFPTPVSEIRPPADRRTPKP
jgi:hypothetical protein